MTDNTLTDHSDGQVIDEEWPNDIHTALRGDFMGRGPTGIPTADQNLGTALIPWGPTRVKSLIVDGILIDFDTTQQIPNKIVSGAIRSTSDQPDFIRADGATNEFDLLATTTNLVITVNGSPATFTADATVTSITLAPSSNNTCLVDDTTLTGQTSSLYTGEDGITLTIDAAGTEITDRIGQYATFKHGTDEYLFAFIKSATELTNIFRGFFFDSAGSPLTREVLSDDDTLTIMSTGWVFAQNNGTTLDVTYVEPIADFVEPSGPATGDYWLDLNTIEWKRYNGTIFVIINRIPIGLVITDTANTVASRSFDFSKIFSDYNTIDLEKESVTVIKSVESLNRISVYGSIINYETSHVKWDIVTDLESGLIEAADTTYHLYVTESGENIIAFEKPYDRLDLKGKYHPYNTWRSVGNVLNDGSSNFEDPIIVNPKTKVEVFDSSGTWLRPTDFPITSVVLIEGWGAGGGGKSISTTGGGGGGSYKYVWKRLSDLGDSETITIGAGGLGQASPTAGGSSSFGSHLTAYGGGAAAGGGAGGGMASNTSGNTNDVTWGEGITDGGNGFFIGAGGADPNGDDGGDSVYGGGGGSAQLRSPGLSQFGGNGGTAGSPGVQPGGGGGSQNGSGSNGGDGRITITVFG
ncbi:MAG: glycine-rich domain-containing protein [Candidatus Anammoxibacter sp.]